MSLKCKLGFHSWDGCKCTECYETRDKKHNWNGCVCSTCLIENHSLNGCICTKCKVEFHRDCSSNGICKNCGKTHDHEYNSENSYKCNHCNKKGKTYVKHYDNIFDITGTYICNSFRCMRNFDINNMNYRFFKSGNIINENCKCTNCNEISYTFISESNLIEFEDVKNFVHKNMK